ncbi:sensor histidine kinase KdpD [Dyadobacter sp. CY312]|uniref:sensor histidine kinase n=1 Tax=Dyadobacter sp. CY312 TaxID=2907303 RepID=UPI001F465370|nr:HAMP domain-containing sensor histidine kinase [Dyadobacter sp. CY312]MCE7038745.1 HAMP domain-containing histidine kinase [Dyadobacter sp. CY312]
MLPTSGLQKYWIRLSGDTTAFPLHARIFHSVCIISIFGLGYNIPFNFFVGLPTVSVVSLVMMLIVAGLYYNSRFKGNTSLSVLVTNFVGLALFFLNYFLNSGINGPTALFFLLFLLITIGINPVNQYKIWIPFNVLIVLALYCFEYYNPEYVPDTYDNRFNQFLDQASAYLVIAIIAFFCMDYIRRGYEMEKQSAIEKTLAIQQKNHLILRQNEELEKLNAQKNKLMSIVAHDLRSPLANIQNYLEVLGDFELDENQKAEIEKDLLNATKETLSMLSKLLAWSKSQSHGMVVNPEYMELSGLLESTLLLEVSAAALKGIELDYYFEPDHIVFADREMMQLVVRNFIGNAIKFTAPGGSIMVRAKCSNKECVISIKDTGIGIPAERRDKLFSLNAKSTYGTKGEKGVGLGLLLCREYMTAQNGSIWYENVAQGGTCFYISIPVSEDASAMVT